MRINGNKIKKYVSAIANNDITKFLNMKLHTYISFDFDFKPYIS